MRRGRSCWVLVFVVLLLWLAGSAEAEAFLLGGNRNYGFWIDGGLRFRYAYLNDFLLDDTGKTLGDPQSGAIFTRFRLAPQVKLGDLKIVAQLDLGIYGSLYGIPSDVGSRFPSILRDQAEGLRPVDPRQLWLSWKSPIGLFKLGQQSSHWGLGLLANNAEKPTGEFAAPRYGDLVERFSLATTPLALFTSSPWARRLVLVAGLDLVFRDENAELIQGDIAVQGVFALFYRHLEQLFVGMYVAIRSQRDRDQNTLQAQAFDAYVRLKQPLWSGGPQLEVAGEAVWLTGRTTRVRNDVAPEGVALEANGAVARLGLTYSFLRVGVEVGYASGDNDTQDGISRQFNFDPDYQPSLILFQRVIAAIRARAADRLADQDRVGQPASGTKEVPTWGRISNAFYVQPILAVRPFFLMPGLQELELKIGLLYARSAVEFADPYNSFRAGGVHRTHLDARAEDRQELGYELNVGLFYHLKVFGFFLHTSVLYGHLFPGNALTDSKEKAMAPIDLFQLRAAILF